MDSPKNRFNEAQYADLQKSGLSDETIEKSGIVALSPRDAIQEIGHDKFLSCYKIPYDKTSYARYKMFYDVGYDNSHPRYLQTKGAGNRLYIPPTFNEEVLQDSSLLYITEGEKKTLKAVQEGINCIGMAGLWNWKVKGKTGNKSLVADFDKILFEDREVFIVPDNDWLTVKKDGSQKNLKIAINKLAEALTSRGAKIFIVSLPKEKKKIGLDDYLINHTKEDFLKLPTEFIPALKDRIPKATKSNYEELLPLIADIKKQNKREEYVREIAKLTGQRFFTLLKIVSGKVKIDEEGGEVGAPDEKDEPEVRKVLNYLRGKYEIRRNIITRAVEKREVGASVVFKPDKLANLNIELQDEGYKYPFPELERMMKESDCFPEFNPFLDYFEKLEPWDGKIDWIEELAEHVLTDNPDFFKVMFKKALVRCIACALDNKENRIVFVLVQEKQRTGKTWFIRYINPWGMEEYYTESPLAKDRGKDIEFRFAENFTYNLEELAKLHHQELETLKAIISKASIKERKAYSRDETKYPRRCSFWGTTNKEQFLTDSENTRWLTFRVLSIDWRYIDLDKKKIWAQAYALYKQGENVFNYDLTSEEFEEAEKMNREHRLDEPERDLILTYFKSCRKGEGEFMTATKIIDIINSKIEPGTGRHFYHGTVGKVLSNLGFTRDKRRCEGASYQVNGWWVRYTDINPYLHTTLKTEPMEEKPREPGEEG